MSTGRISSGPGGSPRLTPDDAIAGMKAAAPGELEGGFSRRVVAWLAGAAAASLVAAGLVSAFGDDLARQPSARPDTWSEGALGHRALFELLAQEGLGVVTRQSRAGMGIGPQRPLVLAEPDPDAGPLSHRAVRRGDGREGSEAHEPGGREGGREDGESGTREGGDDSGARGGEARDRAAADTPYERDALARHAAVVLVVPKWHGEPDPAHPGWVASVELLPVAEALGRVERTLGAAPVEGLRLRRLPAGNPGDPGNSGNSGDHRNSGNSGDPGDPRNPGGDGGDGADGGSLGCAFAAAVAEPGAADVPPAASADGPPTVSGDAPSLRVALAPAQLIAPHAELRPVVACRGGWLAALRPASPTSPAMLLIADPDLLNNQGLGRAENAAVALRLLAGELHAQGLVFDETIHGYHRSTGLLTEALRLPLLPATLHGLLVAALVAWSAGARFGKPLPALRPPAPGKAVLIGNTAELLVRGGHAADSLARYYRYTLQAVGAHFFLPQDLAPAELAARLARLAPRAAAGRRPTAPPAPGGLAWIERRIARLGAAPAGSRGEERAAALAREIYRWRLEMMDGTREGR
jgi:hypothetical protein